MFKLRVLVPGVLIVLMVSGCSSENPATVDPGKPSIGNSQKLSSKPAIVTPEKPSSLPASVAPTRSELRVLTEQAKATEQDVQNVIGIFDANLANPQARKQAETSFKKMLPEYKEKMLLIGKSKLKEGG